MAATPPKHFSMLREFHLADVLTLGNAACGLAGIFFAMQYMKPLVYFSSLLMMRGSLAF